MILNAGNIAQKGSSAGLHPEMMRERNLKFKKEAMRKENCMDNKSNFSRKTGDAIERVGQKISDVGAPNLGKKVYDAGDKLEHMSDEKPLRQDKKTW